MIVVPVPPTIAIAVKLALPLRVVLIRVAVSTELVAPGINGRFTVTAPKTTSLRAVPRTPVIP